MADADQGFQTSNVIDAVQSGSLPVVVDNPGYRIFDVTIKHYPPSIYLVQTSGEPINLGQDMLPFMDTGKLHGFVRETGIPLAADSPAEIYIYRWVEKAQGPMVFDVGVAIARDISIPDGHGFVIKHLPAIKVASIVYEGPFPYQENSGWAEIRWEDRAREQGLRYTQQIYRELYHAYDFDNDRHITEIQISIE
jgi:effector-binding domain-containing protein